MIISKETRQILLTAGLTASITTGKLDPFIAMLAVTAVATAISLISEFLSPTLLTEEDRKRFDDEKRLVAIIRATLQEEAAKLKTTPNKNQGRVVYALTDNELHILREIADGKSPDYGMAGPGLIEIYDGLLSFGLAAVEYEPLLTRTVQRLKITGEGIKTVKAFQYRDQAEMPSPTTESEA